MSWLLIFVIRYALVLEMEREGVKKRKKFGIENLPLNCCSDHIGGYADGWIAIRHSRWAASSVTLFFFFAYILLWLDINAIPLPLICLQGEWSARLSNIYICTFDLSKEMGKKVIICNRLSKVLIYLGADGGNLALIIWLIMRTSVVCLSELWVMFLWILYLKNSW